MATELKPCPLCGCKDIRKITTVFDCTIFCQECRVAIRRENYIKRDSIAETLKEAEPEAIEAWNRRTAKTPCDLCKFNPPSSMDGKPCTMCVADGRNEDGN